MTKPFVKEKAAIESDYASGAHEFAILRGWFTFKVESPTMDSLPDRFYARHGVIIFIEWKKDGEKPTAKQLKRHREMREHGITVYWFDNLEEGKKVLR